MEENREQIEKNMFAVSVLSEKRNAQKKNIKI